LAVNSLALKGLAIVQTPGTSVLRVVELDRAATLARLEVKGLEGASAGFVKALVPLRELDAERAKAVVTLVLSGKGSRVEAVTGSNALLVADFAPQVAQALALLERLDKATEAPLIVEVPLLRADPAALAALVSQIRAKEVAASGQKREG
jgi:type II secretory pathway component GspD/PulD (secretin)